MLPVFMTQENLASFLAAIKADPSLRQRVSDADDPETIVSIAAQAGYTISFDDYKRSQQSIADEQLEGVAGGGGSNCCGDTGNFGCSW